jgi:hypothetical protein
MSAKQLHGAKDDLARFHNAHELVTRCLVRVDVEELYEGNGYKKSPLIVRKVLPS